jgi:hypothetical protein
MSSLNEVTGVLREALTVFEEALTTVEAQGRTLQEAPMDAAVAGVVDGKRRALLPRLVDSLARLRNSRVAWQGAGPEVRAGHPDVGTLVRRGQELLMKIIVLDRENEQALLRRGLVPVRDLPSVHRQQPHYVTDLYRRRGSG